MRGRLLVGLVGVLFVAGCTSNPTPTTTVAAPTLSSTPTSGPVLITHVTVTCGPLDAQLCQKAVAVAEASLPRGHAPVVSVRVQAPSAQMTCPPSGGLGHNLHDCGVIAIVSTTAGQFDIGLVRSGDGWIWANLIR
jgi:hypothetical protein